MQFDTSDARWLYYSLNPAALEEMNRVFGTFFEPARIKPRRATCGPQSTPVDIGDLGILGC
jgi:ArsR family transcriptional regulator